MASQTAARREVYYRIPIGLILLLVSAGCSSPKANDAGSSLATSRPIQASAAKYEGKLVRRPGPTVEDSKVYEVMQGKKRWIANGDWIAAHGFKWPDDVNTISAAELEAIPLGEPISTKN